MWAIAFDNSGLFRCGNNGAQRLYNCSRNGIALETTQLRRNNQGGVVFIMHDYTQEMCEMNNQELYHFCSSNHIMKF